MSWTVTCWIFRGRVRHFLDDFGMGDASLMAVQWPCMALEVDCAFVRALTQRASPGHRDERADPGGAPEVSTEGVETLEQRSIPHLTTPSERAPDHRWG